jgi:NADH-quinone oxidoreductase subunit J
MSIAVIYLGLQAPFLAAMHVLVYTGAILVLFLFVIMLLNLRPPELGRELSPWIRVLIAILCVALFVMFCVPIIQGTKGYTIQPPPHGFGSVKGVGQTLFTYYLLPFELLSLVLLIAMIGGVILAKRRL